MTPDPARRGAPTLPGVLVGLVIAFCALLLLRWLALVALAVLLAVAALRWARGLRVLPDLRGVLAPASPSSRRPPWSRPPPPAVPDDDCSWCGRPGGHLGRDGERIRPRHAHALR